MSKKKKQSECPSDICSATNPNIYDANMDEIPESVKKVLAERGWASQIHYCGYCGDHWVSVERGGRFLKVTIGVKPLERPIEWVILNNT